MVIKLKPLVISVLIPLLVGGLSALLSMDGMREYMSGPKPPFSPPDIVFPIAWTLLYTLMGISAYLVYMKKPENSSAFLLYGLQLAVNFFWSIIFFTFKNYVLAFVWLLLLIVLVIAMIISFWRVSKVAGYLQIPYLLWLIFAAILNFGVIMMRL